MTLTTEKRIQWLLFFSVAIVYALTLTRNYYWDGIDFAMTIEKASRIDTSLLHPNHLVYSIVGFVVNRAVNVFGTDLRALFVLQYLNCIAGAGCVALLFRVLVSLLGKIAPAFWLSVIFAFSATWWKFTTDADAYILSVFFLLAAFYYLLPTKEPRPLLVAALHVAAMCFHELAVIFVLAAVVGLYLQKGRLKAIALYVAAAGISVLGIYCLAYRWMTGGLDAGMFKWMTSSSAETGFGFEAARNLGYAAGGQFKLFLGGRFGSFREIYQPLAFVLLGLLAICFVCLVASLVGYWRGRADRRTEPLSDRNSVLIAAAWTGVYLLFLIFWEPQHTFYRLFYFPAVIILIGLWLRRFDLGELSRRVLPFTASVVALANLLFFIIPYSQVRTGTPLALGYEMNSVLSPGAVVLYANRSSDLELVEYLNRQAEFRKVSSGDLTGVNADEIWVDDSYVKQFGDSGITITYERQLTEPYNLRLAKVKNKDGGQ